MLVLFVKIMTLLEPIILTKKSERLKIGRQGPAPWAKSVAHYEGAHDRRCQRQRTQTASVIPFTKSLKVTHLQICKRNFFNIGWLVSLPPSRSSRALRVIYNIYHITAASIFC